MFKVAWSLHFVLAFHKALWNFMSLSPLNEPNNHWLDFIMFSKSNVHWHLSDFMGLMLIIAQHTAILILTDRNILPSSRDIDQSMS